MSKSLWNINKNNTQQSAGPSASKRKLIGSEARPLDTRMDVAVAVAMLAFMAAVDWMWLNILFG